MSDRKKKFKNISGWILIDKPRGISSSAVVNKIKWCLNAKKAGPVSYTHLRAHETS